jgi:rfaE bifunctional protein kinase chain/domain
MDEALFSSSCIKKAIADIAGSKIMVIGDVMLDEYLWGEVLRISPEAPVPVLDLDCSSQRLGGAANVVKNLASLGVKPILISIRGDDEKGRQLSELLEKLGCNTDGLMISHNRPTTVKTRIMAKHQQIVRVDSEVRKDLDRDEVHLAISIFDSLISKVNAVIISDYSKGVVCKVFVEHIVATCQQKGIFISIDPKERHFELYKGVDVITPNLKESLGALGLPFRHYTNEEIFQFGWTLLHKLDLNYLLMTLSEKGMALYCKDNLKMTHLPTVAQKVFDVTGAGDTVISVFTAIYAAGASSEVAAFIANHAAGITVAELGTASVDPEMLLSACLNSIDKSGFSHLIAST